MALGLVLSACAGELVVRAQPVPRAAVADSALAALAPLRVEVSDVAGATSSSEPVGRRAGGLGLGPGPILLTEDVATVVRRTVVSEFEAAGLRVVGSGAPVFVALKLLEFALDAPRDGGAWEISARLRLALRVSARPGDEDWDEFVYTSERSKRTPLWPGVGSVEQVLGEALADLGALIAQRPALAAALRRHADASRE